MTIVRGDIIARGAQGILCNAKYQRPGAAETEPVALKVLEGTPEHLSAIQNTAQRFVAHTCPSLISYKEVRREATGELSIVMPLLQGKTLEQIDLSTLSAPSIVRVTLQVAKALAHMHGLTPPCVHRDVNLSNIMHCHGGDAVLIDLEQAAAPRQSAARENCGTDLYQSPESMAGTYTPASDIFSLGCVLFALMAKPECVLLAHPSGHELALYHKSWSPNQLETAVRNAVMQEQPNYNAGLVQLLIRMLAHDARARPTAAAVVAELEKLRV